MKRYFPNLSDLDKIYPEAMRVWISGPSIVTVDEKFELRISLLGLDGYLVNNFEGEFIIKDNSGIRNLPEKIVFSNDGPGSLIISGCSISEEGIHHFKVSPSNGSFPAGQSHPILVQKESPYYLFWGDFHVHSVLGKCGTDIAKSPDFGYWYARDVVGHNFCGITDHARNLNDEDWEQLRFSAKSWHEPQRFVSILGFEGDYDGEDGGHFNLHFPSDKGDYKNFKMDAGGTLRSIFNFASDHKALAICHHTSRHKCGRDFSRSYYGGQDIEPVMEIYSQWGSSEEFGSSRPMIESQHPNEGHYYRYALSHGFPLGVVGGSDSHCTTPGGLTPMAYPEWGGKQFFPYPGGVTAIYATELTRKGLFEALRERRCYASSFEKFLLWVESGGSLMGSEIEAASAEIEILVSCTYRPLWEVLVLKNGGVAARFGIFGENRGFDIERKTFHLVWRDENFSKESCYYVRATQYDGDMAWSSPIWIKPS